MNALCPPSPQGQTLPCAAPAPVLGLGAFLKNTVCWLSGTQVYWRPSPQDDGAWSSHGDLRDPQACTALQASVQRLVEQAGPGGIAAVAHDMHPDFFSTQWALQVAETLGVPAVAVAHHHAHLGVVMAEQGWLTDDSPVLGLALDGVGLGPDGAAWGGEALTVLRGEMRRVGSLPQLRLPGGDAAALSPWRLRLSVAHALGEDQTEASVRGAVPKAQAEGVAQMLDRNLNCPPTTAAGRWFDAVAGLLGLCEQQSHEAQAAQAVQAVAQAAQAAPAAQDAVSSGAAGVVGAEDPASDDTWWALMRHCLRLGQQVRLHQASGQLLPLDLQTDIERAALAFHRLMAARLTANLAATVKSCVPLGQPVRVALGGGCFLNPLLRGEVLAQGQSRGWVMALPGTVSCGDAGLALGQAWVAAQALTRTPPSGGARCD